MRSANFTPRLLVKALRGLIDLAAARIDLTRIRPNGVQLRNREFATLRGPNDVGLPTQVLSQRCDEAAYFISGVARRVPWRSDCLVQALAGQRWLARHGIPSEIVIGTSKSPGGLFEAHAWLRQGDRIVLGGDIARFHPLLEPRAVMSDQD